MMFNNYCAVFIINIEGVDEEVKRISEGLPHSIVGKGIMIVTFVSPLEGNGIEEYFKSLGRNFMFFDVNEPGSGYFFEKDEYRVEVFDNMFKTNKIDLNKLSNKFMQNIDLIPKMEYKDVTDVIIVDIDNDNIDIFEHIDTLTYNEKNEMMNNLIDKGRINNFKYTDRDIKILSKLANS